MLRGIIAEGLPSGHLESARSGPARVKLGAVWHFDQ